MKKEIQNKTQKLNIFYKKLAIKAIGLFLLIFLNLDSTTFCETFDEVKETLVEKSWSEWAWDNKGKILILTGVGCIGIVIGYYYFMDNTPPIDDNLTPPSTPLNKDKMDSDLVVENSTAHVETKSINNSTKNNKIYMDCDFDDTKKKDFNLLAEKKPMDNITSTPNKTNFDLSVDYDTEDFNLGILDQTEKLDNEPFLDNIPNDNMYKEEKIVYEYEMGGLQMCKTFNLSYTLLNDYATALKSMIPLEDHQKSIEIFEKIIQIEAGNLQMTKEELSEVLLNKEILKNLNNIIRHRYKTTAQFIIDNLIEK